jgi:hypothetical protein
MRTIVRSPGIQAATVVQEIANMVIEYNRVELSVAHIEGSPIDMYSQQDTTSIGSIYASDIPQAFYDCMCIKLIIGNGDYHDRNAINDNWKSQYLIIPWTNNPVEGTVFIADLMR